MNVFKFHDVNGEKINLPAGKIVCVGRNYLEHIQELNNEVPTDAVLFMKPESAFVDFEQGVILPNGQGETHHEVELAILISKPLMKATAEESISSIAGYSIALDLTLRELQSKLKKKGLPWEKAKAFDGSCPIGGFICNDSNWQDHDIKLIVNDEIRQSGNTQQMIRSVPQLLAEISHWFTLKPGDVVLTGTPSGVACLKSGDNIEVILDNKFHWKSTVN